MLSLPTIVRFAPWILAGLAVAGALYYRSDAADARADQQRDRPEIAERIATNNAAVVEKLEALAAKADEATAREIARERAAKQAVATSLSEIDNAPPTADGPVAPVLRDALRARGVR